MSIYLQDPDFTLLNGDAAEMLRTLAADSVDCALTSPPFYALRDYGVDGQIGLEDTADEWASRLVDVFREVRRVLKPEGTLWVECGDSYAGTLGNGRGGGSTLATRGYPEAHFATWPEALVERILKAGCPPAGTCLDPFMGSGTTALVARRLGLRSVGVELNTDYCALAARRLQQQSLFAEPAA